MTDTSRTDLPTLLAQLAQLLAETPPAPPTETPRAVPARVLLTVEEAAEQLGIGRTLAYRLVRDGEIESVRIGRLRRIPAAAVHEYARRLLAAAPHSAA